MSADDAWVADISDRLSLTEPQADERYNMLHRMNDHLGHLSRSVGQYRMNRNGNMWRSNDAPGLDNDIASEISDVVPEISQDNDDFFQRVIRSRGSATECPHVLSKHIEYKYHLRL